MTDEQRFTEGDCHLLARRIHRLTGWPIYCFDYGGKPSLHAFVVMPDGRALDVEGPRTLLGMKRRWKGPDVREFTLAQLRHWGGAMIDRESYRRARIVADELLAQVGS